MEIRAKTVILNEEGVYSAAEICRMYNISERTLRRWKMRHKNGWLEGLKPIKPLPKEAKQGIDSKIERRIITLKQNSVQDPRLGKGLCYWLYR